MAQNERFAEFAYRYELSIFAGPGESEARGERLEAGRVAGKGCRNL